MITRFLSPCLGWLVLTVAPLEHADAKPPADLKKQIAIIQAVGTEGTGNAEAAVAFRELARAKASALLPLLRAIEPSNPIARNWLRSAVEVIVERELAATKPLPFADLKAFLADRTQSPEARRLAFDLMLAIDRATAEAMVPGFLDDPSTELRRDAVELLISEGRKQLAQETGDTATATYRKALDSARDVDQIQEIAKALTNLKQQVDLPRHFGFLTDWQIIGPFHNNDRKGFAEEFPPENSINLKASYPGKESKVQWQALATSDPYGKVDLNKPYGKLKEVTSYAYHEFNSAETQPAELRLGCKNAWKVWLNGQLLFGRDEYHRGQRIDQYKMPVQLKKGTNSILIKLCQNEQKEDWTVQWEFQLRVCDTTGTAILATNRPKSNLE
ncbi:MAG: hypothetical protein MK194_00875 [Roseibacillus sp.]|nr:hypothetical protein [Roseibacillus sp.]